MKRLRPKISAGSSRRAAIYLTAVESSSTYGRAHAARVRRQDRVDFIAKGYTGTFSPFMSSRSLAPPTLPGNFQPKVL